MSIVRKVRAIERIFAELDREITDFRQSSQLSCLAGCGICCKKPDIEATVIEFLPLALHFYLTGRAESVLSELKNDHTGICHVFRNGTHPEAGLCSEYAYRGLICRLFGFSARKNKYGENEFTTCKKIKNAFPERYADAFLLVKKGLKIPVMVSYYKRLLWVDFELAQQTHPVNVAIQKAIEMVLSYYAYRRKPVRVRA